jgi:hypothetical protein
MHLLTEIPYYFYCIAIEWWVSGFWRTTEFGGVGGLSPESTFNQF